MTSSPGPILVTGANGHLGRGLIAAAEDASLVRAVVRSDRAADQVRAARDVEVRVVDYTDPAALADAARGCRAAVHFVGIIKETKAASYEDAHERTCEALVAAAAEAGLERIVYLSIVGSRPDAANACLASKGRAERILIDAEVPACVLRVPMVLGRGDYASFSLGRQARAGLLPMVGGGATLQQPIDARDVLVAVRAALDLQPAIDDALDLGGPECMPHRELVARASGIVGGKAGTVLPIPVALARAGIALMERLSGSPPMTSAMFEVLQHDDRVDTEETRKRLGIELTPLDETLTHCLVTENG